MNEWALSTYVHVQPYGHKSSDLQRLVTLFVIISIVVIDTQHQHRLYAQSRHWYYYYTDFGPTIQRLNRYVVFVECFRHSYIQTNNLWIWRNRLKEIRFWIRRNVFVCVCVFVYVNGLWSNSKRHTEQKEKKKRKKVWRKTTLIKTIGDDDFNNVPHDAGHTLHTRRTGEWNVIFNILFCLQR